MTMPPVVEVVLVVLAHATGAWVVTYLVHGTLLFGVAWMLERARPEQPAWRVMLWRTALVGPLVTATLQTALPHFSRPLAVRLEPANALLGPRPLIAGVVILLWTVTLVVGVLRAMRARRRARVALGPRVPADQPAHRERIERWARLAGVRDAPHVTVSSRIASPAALSRQEICIPAGIFDALAPEEQDALLAHEISHVASGDPAWYGVGATVAQVFVFQPLNRIALRRLRRAAEEAADAFAVRRGGDPIALARALASLAPHVMQASYQPAAATGSPVIARMARILDGRAEASRDLGRGRALAWATAILLLCQALGPGARFNVSSAANSIPWLAPSTEEPGVRMLEVRRLERRAREVVRVRIR